VFSVRHEINLRLHIVKREGIYYHHSPSKCSLLILKKIRLQAYLALAEVVQLVISIHFAAIGRIYCDMTPESLSSPLLDDSLGTYSR
jgi:hypothetical protein